MEDLTNAVLREQRKKLADLSGELQNGFHDPSVAKVCSGGNRYIFMFIVNMSVSTHTDLY